MGLNDDTTQQEKSLAQKLYQARQDQYDRWIKGEWVDASDYFARSPELLLNREAALDLIYGQFCLAENAGLSPSSEAYLAKYPEYASELKKLLEVHRELGHFSLNSGDSLSSQSEGSQATIFELGQGVTEAGKPTSTVGARRLGRYDLFEKIGEGTFGAVYRGIDSKLNRVVAVKIPRSNWFASAADEERFVREASSVAQLDHPGIVRIFDIGRDQGIPFLVAELIQGTVLSNIMESERFAYRDAATLIKKVCMAIDHAHCHGIIHRDLKPSNIILTLDREPKVLDFGLAKSDGTPGLHSVEGAIMGAPAYMSPEQATGKGHQADARSDVYSLGVILYQLLTGELPYRGTFQAIVDQMRTRDPLDARQLDPLIPRDLNTICMKALAKEPSRRFTTAEEMAEELNRYLEKKPILSHPISKVAKVGLWCRRNPGISILTVSMIASLLLGTIVSSFFAVHSSIHAARARRQAELLRRTLYNNDIALIQQAVGTGQVARANSLLERSSPEYRRWEWYHWNSKLHEELRTIHAAAETIIAFQADGSLLAIGDASGTVRLFELKSGSILGALPLHDSAVTAMNFSPDGTLLLTAAEDSTARAWMVSQLLSFDKVQPQHEYESILGVVNSFVFRPDASGFVMGTRQGIWQFRSTRANTMLFNLDWGTSSVAAALSRTNNLLTFAMGNEVIEMEIPGGAKRVLYGHDAPITGLSTSTDGQWIVSTSQDRTAKVWNQEKQSYRTLRGHTDAILSSAVSPSSDLVVTAGKDGLIRIWDIRTGEPLSSIRWHLQTVTQLSFVAGGDLLASVDSEGCIKLWDMREVGLNRNHATTSGDGCGRLAYSSDGRFIAYAASDGGLGLYEANSGVELQILVTGEGECEGLAFAGKGHQLLALYHGRLLHWTLPTQEREKDSRSTQSISTTAKFAMEDLSASPDLQEHGQEQSLRCFAVSATDEYFAYATDRGVYLKNLNLRQSTELKAHPSPGCVIAFSHDSAHLAVGCLDGTLQIFNVATGARVARCKEHVEEITDLVFCPDGRSLASASADGTARRWSVDGGPSLLTITGHNESVNSVCFDSTGDRILTASDDRTLRLWDTDDGMEMMSLECDPRTQGRFSPDGSQLTFGLTAGGIEHFNTRLLDYDERMARWEARRIVDQYPYVTDAITAFEAQLHWSPKARKAAVHQIESTASTIPDIPKRILSLLSIESAERLSIATRLAEAFFQHNPDDQLAKTLLAACLCAANRNDDAFKLLPTSAEIEDAPTAMIALLAANSNGATDRLAQQPLVELVRATLSSSLANEVAGIEADFGRFFNSVLEERLLLGQLHYQKAEFERAHYEFTFVEQFTTLSSEQRMMFVTSLAVQRRWKDAANVHAQIEHQVDDWLYLTNDAILKLAAEDVEGYRNGCKRLLSLDYRHAEPTKALLAAIACLAGDGAVDEPQQLLDFVKDLQSLPNSHPATGILLGLAQLRCGALKEAQATLRPWLLMTELASSDVGSMVLGEQSAEIKLAQLTCVSTLLQVEHQLGNMARAQVYAERTEELVEELEQTPPIYDGRLGPWNHRVAAHFARQILVEWQQHSSN